MRKETARKAAQWWAKFLETPKTPDNGDKSENGFMASVLASMVQDIQRTKLPPDAAKKFEDSLADILDTMNQDWMCFGVDYHPDYVLDRAALTAGIELGMTLLPWKTTMWIEGDIITVRAGYNAESRVLE